MGTNTCKDNLMNSLAQKSDCDQKEDCIKSKDLACLQINPNHGLGNREQGRKGKIREISSGEKRVGESSGGHD